MKSFIANKYYTFGIVAMSAMLLGASPLLNSAQAENTSAMPQALDESKGAYESDKLPQSPSVINDQAASPEDKAITQRVSSALTGFNDVSVNTEGRVVTLMGTVSSLDDKQKALGLARNVDGVWTVKDKLEIK